MSAAPAHICPLAPLDPLPRLTQALPGCGGRMRVEIEDFEVEEIATYDPSGDGEHLFLWVEKRDMAAETMRKAIARALGVAAGDIGMAGMKDRRAVTRQWVSVPRRCESRLPAIQDDRICVLDAVAHRNKLRTGHLDGNRFSIRLRGPVADAAERISAKLAMITEHGLPNFYGSQRMGHGGATLAAGWALAHGAHGLVRLQLNDGTQHTFDLGDRQLRRLAASALQAEVFNRTVAARMADGIFATVLLGDVCRKTDTGGQFVSDDIEREQLRLAGHALEITGPMWGPKMPQPAADAAVYEAAVLSALGLELGDFSALGHLAEGTRRPIRIRPANLRCVVEQDAVVLQFELPAGAFATTVVGEIAGPVEHEPELALTSLSHFGLAESAANVDVVGVLVAAGSAELAGMDVTTAGGND